MGNVGGLNQEPRAHDVVRLHPMLYVSFTTKVSELRAEGP
jgi:hypothetical protein